MVIHFNKAVSDTAVTVLDKQRRKKTPLVSPEIRYLCDQRQDLMNKIDKHRQIKAEIKVAKNQLVKDLTTEKKVNIQTNKTSLGSVFQASMKFLACGKSAAQTLEL